MKKKLGFTLVELMVVLTVIALLLSVVVPDYVGRGGGAAGPSSFPVPSNPQPVQQPQPQPEAPRPPAAGPAPKQ